MSRGPSTHRFASFSVAAGLMLFLGLNSNGASPLTPTSSPPRIHPQHFCTTYTPPTGHLRTTTSTIPTTGTLSLVYIRVRYPDDPPEPVPLEEATRDLTQGADLLHSISYGQCTLDWTITPVLTLPRPRQDYTFGDSFMELIKDARAAALAQGIDYSTYTLDIVRHTGLSNLAAGSAMIGARGLQLAVSGPFILVHEIGHNLGLFHANFWNTQGPELPMGSPPLPSDLSKHPDPLSIPVHPDSALGHPTLTGPGQSVEYGDPWDIMGSGADEFSVPHRRKLGWIDDQSIAVIRHSSANRLYAPETTKLTPGHHYALRIPSGDRELWVQLSSTNVSRPQSGLVLRWANPEAHMPTDLLQPTLAFVEDPFERTLPLGITFSDPFRNFHITGIQEGNNGSERWMDIITERPPPPQNRKPTLSLSAHPSSVMPGKPVSFTAIAQDPDGDTLSWHWDFDDATTASRTHQMEKSWPKEGDYMVQVTVSDHKGGVARSHLIIQVGNPPTAKLLGRITDEQGNPVAGARVYGLRTEGKDRTFRWMLTDSDGVFGLTQLTPGTYTNGAFAFGYHIPHAPPVPLALNETRVVAYQAQTLAQVQIQSAQRVYESSGWVDAFTLTRTGPTSGPLTVPFRITGSAEPGTHYAEPASPWITFQPGESVTTLPLQILDAPGVEPWKTIEVHLDIPQQTQAQRADESTYTRYFPGFDLEKINDQEFWVLTEPEFIPGPAASLTVVDDELRLDLIQQDALTITLQIQGIPGMAVHVEQSSDLMHWTWFSTQFLPRNGQTWLDIPKQPNSTRFFRLNLPTN